MDAPVDEALHVGLRDDERLRLLQERQDLRRHLQFRPAPPQDVHRRIAEDAEAGILPRHRHAIRPVEPVLAHAEQRHVVVRGPFQEGDRLVRIRLGIGWRVRLEVGDGVGEPLAHGAEILDGLAHMVVDAGQASLQLGCERLGQRRQVDVDVALARPLGARGGPRRLARQLAGRVPLDAEDRMRHQLGRDTALA